MSDTEDSSASLALLAQLGEAHLDIGRRLSAAEGGALYGLDFLAFAALNRSKAQVSGFSRLIEVRNLVCAGAILRLQLDTALRFSAAWLVDDPHAFAFEILHGTPVRRMKDRAGNKMTDRYLVDALGREFEWVPRVYDKTSGYIHLSDVHIMSAIETADETGTDRVLQLKISDVDKSLPDAIYVEAVDAFAESTRILLGYVEGWIATKNRTVS